MLSTYFRYGDVEIVNAARVRQYAMNAGCGAILKIVDGMECLPSMLEQTYSTPLADDAPWADPYDQASFDFYGIYTTAVRGLSSSTLQASVTEAISDGGSVGTPRKASRSVEFTATLLAGSMASLEYGTAWLAAVLESRPCADDVQDCGDRELRFFVDCVDIVDDSPVESQVSHAVRVLHKVRTTEGPLEIATREVSGGYMREVAFTLVAGVPWVFSLPQDVPADFFAPEVLLDSPSNLFVRPSAEMSGPLVTVVENLIPNPSLETNATGWSHSSTSGSTAGRTTDLSAVGNASYRVRRSLAAGPSGAQNFLIKPPQVILSSPATGRQTFSVGISLFPTSSAPITGFGGNASYLRFYDASDSWMENMVFTDYSLTADVWNRIQFDSIEFPEGAVRFEWEVIAAASYPMSFSAFTIDLYADAASVITL